VLPDGTLVNAFLQITSISSQPQRWVAVQRSTEKGVSWPEPPIVFETAGTVGVTDPKNGRLVRTGAIIPGIAADPSSGKLYVVWQDSRFSGGLRDAIALSTSVDRGRSWTMPIRVSQSPDVAAFTPAVAVSATGRVAVTYYDFRPDNPGNPNSLLTSYWLVTSEDGGATWEETAVAQGFDMRTAPVAEGYFVGDYEGLASDGTSFIPFFSAASFPGHTNFTGVYVQSRTQ
jgi:hypothetical protein